MQHAHEARAGRAALASRERAVPRGDIMLARRWVAVTLDALMLAGGFAGGLAARYSLHIGGLQNELAPSRVSIVVFLGLLAVTITVLELARHGLYRHGLGAGGLDAALTMARATTLAMAVVILATAALREQSISRLAYFYAWTCMLLALGAGRGVRAALLARLYQRGRGVRNVVVIGATSISKMVMQNVAARQRRGYRVLGFIGEHAATPPRFGRFARLGLLHDVERVLAVQSVDEIIVALPAPLHARAAEIFAYCQREGIAVKVVPDLFDLRLSRVHMDVVTGTPLIDVQPETVARVSVALKRVLDLIVAALTLVVCWPILLITAVAITLDSPGPVLFRQERLGRDGRAFTILKFRSMRIDAERQLALLRDQNEASGPIFKMRCDPRVTRVGRIIRKLSIDELPQLWNVLRGEMSLVGPRPPLASEVARYEEWHRRRLEVTPGITCLWGISGRSMLDFDEMVMLDLYYIDNWSLRLDLRILVLTAVALLRPSGAY